MTAPRQFAIDFSGKQPPAVQEKIAEGMQAADETLRWPVEARV